MRAVSTEEIRRIDNYAIRELGIPSLTLMEHAATAVADTVCRVRKSGCVIAVCGTGNNGGDGLACARLLKDRGLEVLVYLVGNPAKLTPDARENADRLAAVGIPVENYGGAPLPACGCIVDALFGFGLNREVGGLYRTAIEAINAAGVPTVACDLPSGLNGDSGQPMGLSVKATHTVTFTLPKKGLLLPEAAEWVGELTTADIGIPLPASEQ